MQTLTIASTNFKQSFRTPVYVILNLVSAGVIFISQYLTLFVLNRVTITVIEVGFSTILLSSFFLSVFSSIHLIYYEIQNKTIVNLLSKPIQKPKVILGKYIGSTLAICLSALVQFGVLYGTAKMCAAENRDLLFDAKLMNNLFVSLILLLSQLFVISSVTTFFSTIFPLSITALLSFMVFTLGHLMDFFRFSVGDALWFKILMAWVPNLDFFNLINRIGAPEFLPFGYAILSLAYGGIYVAIFLTLAVIVFEKIDMK